MNQYQVEHFVYSASVNSNIFGLSFRKLQRAGRHSKFLMASVIYTRTISHKLGPLLDMRQDHLEQGVYKKMFCLPIQGNRSL